MSGLQAAFNSASATPSCPAQAAQCSAVPPFCKDGSVSRQSGARMLHCCPYSESNTQIKEGMRNSQRDKVYSAQDNNSNFVYHICLKEAHACNANRRKHTTVRPHTHSKQDTNTHTLTHTLTNTRARGKTSHKHTRETCPRDTKDTYNYIIPKVWLAAQQHL